MISNFFLTTENLLQKGLLVTRFRVPEFERIRDPSKVYRVARRIGYRLERNFGGIFETMGREMPDIVLYHPKKPVNTLQLEFIDGSFRVIPAEEVRLDPSFSNHRRALEGIIRSLLTQAFKRMEYEKFKGILRKPHYKKIYTHENNPVLFYLDALQFSIRVFADGTIGVWMDLKSIWDQPANVLIEHKLNQGMTEEDIRKLLLEKKMNVTLEPGYISGIISDVIFDRTIETFILKDDLEKRTVAEYWRQEYRRNLPRSDFIVMARRVGLYKDLAYPASLVHLSTKEERIPFRFMQLLHISPADRLERLQELIRSINLQQMVINSDRMLIKEESVHWETLIHEEKCKAVGTRGTIPFRMAKNKCSTDPRDVLEVGPLSGKKDVDLVLVLPSKFKDLIAPFLDILQTHFETFKMGNLRLMETFEIGTPTPMNYWEKGYEVGRYFDLQKGENKIALVVLPEKVQSTIEYFEFRRGIGRAKDLTSKTVQMIRPETVKRVISKKDQNLIGNILVQIYLKTLIRGEAVWLLNEPAGGSPHTCYMGYDVSRITERLFDPTSKTWIREMKEAAAYAAVCDSYGRVIECRSLPAQRGEMLTPDDVVRLLYEVLHECKTSMNEFYGEDFTRLVIFRDGNISSTDLQMMDRGIEKLFETIGNKYTKLTIDVVAVIKTGIERLFSDDRTNPSVGDYVILDESNALLCTSDLKQRSDRLSAKPIKLYYPLSKSLDYSSRRRPMEHIVHEFVDLTKLYWVSLVYTPKVALPLKIVQRIGQLAVRDVSVPRDVPYIPL